MSVELIGPKKSQNALAPGNLDLNPFSHPRKNPLQQCCLGNKRFLISSCFRIHRFPYKISHLCIYSCVHKRARVYACAYVCMYVSISVHMCASTSVYTARLSMNICTFEYMNNICTTMRENICMYTCSEANMHARCDLY